MDWKEKLFQYLFFFFKIRTENLRMDYVPFYRLFSNFSLPIQGALNGTKLLDHKMTVLYL